MFGCFKCLTKSFLKSTVISSNLNFLLILLEYFSITFLRSLVASWFVPVNQYYYLCNPPRNLKRTGFVLSQHVSPCRPLNCTRTSTGVGFIFFRWYSCKMSISVFLVLTISVFTLFKCVLTGDYPLYPRFS